MALGLQDKRGLDDWQEFVLAVEKKFGADDYRKSIQELMCLKQEGTVEEYTQEFQDVQYQLCMFNTWLDEMFFTSHYVNGLKEEIRAVVQTQLPVLVDRVALLAKLWQ
jgi:hypothetical protein